VSVGFAVWLAIITRRRLQTVTIRFRGWAERLAAAPRGNDANSRPEGTTAMQIVVAFIALPAVALLLALASRLEDGLRAAARPVTAPLALPPGPSATPAELELTPASPGP
jgi:hypothetical protein